MTWETANTLRVGTGAKDVLRGLPVQWIHSFVRPCLALLTRTALGLSNVCRPEGQMALQLSINRYRARTSQDHGQDQVLSSRLQILHDEPRVYSFAHYPVACSFSHSPFQVAVLFQYVKFGNTFSCRLAHGWQPSGKFSSSSFSFSFPSLRSPRNPSWSSWCSPHDRRGAVFFSASNVARPWPRPGPVAEAA